MKINRQIFSEFQFSLEPIYKGKAVSVKIKASIPSRKQIQHSPIFPSLQHIRLVIQHKSHNTLPLRIIQPGRAKGLFHVKHISEQLSADHQ